MKGFDALAVKAAVAVRPAYVANEWVWGGCDRSEAHVPSEAELAMTIRRLLQDLAESDAETRSIGTGRLIVDKTTDEVGNATYGVLLSLGDSDDE